MTPSLPFDDPAVLSGFIEIDGADHDGQVAHRSIREGSATLDRNCRRLHRVRQPAAILDGDRDFLRCARLVADPRGRRSPIDDHLDDPPRHDPGADDHGASTGPRRLAPGHRPAGLGGGPAAPIGRAWTSWWPATMEMLRVRPSDLPIVTRADGPAQAIGVMSHLPLDVADDLGAYPHPPSSDQESKVSYSAWVPIQNQMMPSGFSTPRAR